jgi:integrase
VVAKWLPAILATGETPKYIADMRTKITKRAVDQLSAGEPDKILWDSELKGFGVRCRESGAKHYVLKLRIAGRQRWLTIGRHGSPWTADGARREATRLLGLRAAGKDPASERDRQKGVITVAELGSRFLNDYVPQHCKATTAGEYSRSVELFISPALGSRRLSDLLRADVAQFHHELRDRPYQANRALGVLCKMMNLAEEWGLREDGSNPCRHVKRYRERRRERYLSREELQRLGAALVEAQNAGIETPFALAAIGLLLLTGARLTEILTLRWDYVDLEKAVLRLPDSKTGAKPIYLNDAAIKLLRTIPRMAGNPFVIAGRKPGSRLVNLQKPWRRIRAMAGLGDVRIHDLRHSFASVAAGAGMSLPVIGKLLGHSQPVTTARYAHLAADPVRAASNLIGNEISAAMKKRRHRTASPFDVTTTPSYPLPNCVASVSEKDNSAYRRRGNAPAGGAFPKDKQGLPHPPRLKVAYGQSKNTDS